MSETNLSKTKPALRTSGGVTGNFGAGRRKGGSALNDVPANSRESLGNFPTPYEYHQRLIKAYHLTDDQRTKGFILGELKRLKAQMPVQDRILPEPTGSYCIIDDHHVGPHQA